MSDWIEESWRLCDDDGTVRRGAMHHGTDYPCTGSAHYAGYHITCTNPVHDAPEPIVTVDGDGFTLWVPVEREP